MKNRKISLAVGLLLLTGFLLMASAPQFFTSYGPKEMFRPWEKPSGLHPLGTNALGYDVFTELVYGTAQTLLIGTVSSVVTLLLGALIGILAARSDGIGSLFSGLINVFVLIPRLITLIVLSTFIGNSTGNLIWLISAFGWVGTARNVRAKVISMNQKPFIENCIIQGYSHWHIILYHLLPNLSDVLLSRFLLGVNSCIMMESTLSFLGFGDLYDPTWGTMINFAFKRGAFMRQAYAYLLMPGLCIMLLSLSFYFISLFFEGRKETIAEM